MNPLLKTPLLQGSSYYWTTTQAEYSTDLLFASRDKLSQLDPRLLDHATVNFGAADIPTFLGGREADFLEARLAAVFACLARGGEGSASEVSSLGRGLGEASSSSAATPGGKNGHASLLLGVRKTSAAVHVNRQQLVRFPDRPWFADRKSAATGGCQECEGRGWFLENAQVLSLVVSWNFLQADSAALAARAVSMAKQHGEIYVAIRKRDPNRAARLMPADVSGMKARVLDTIQRP